MNRNDTFDDVLAAKQKLIRLLVKLIAIAVLFACFYSVFHTEEAPSLVKVLWGFP